MNSKAMQELLQVLKGARNPGDPFHRAVILLVEDRIRHAVGQRKHDRAKRASRGTKNQTPPNPEG